MIDIQNMFLWLREEKLLFRNEFLLISNQYSGVRKTKISKMHIWRYMLLVKKDITYKSRNELTPIVLFFLSIPL